MPLITLGVPVYNGVALISECLENLARQTLRDFEVIISDNASTDGTSEICDAFCQRDRRFRHVRHTSTSSANDNFIFVRNRADCDYFAFRAYDDLSGPDFLECLSGVLDDAPACRLAVGTVRQEFASGKRRLHKYPLTVTEDLGPPKDRILCQMFDGHASWFYGLWRHQGLIDSYDRVIKDYDDPWGCDHLILLHAMLADGIRGYQGDAVFVQRVLSTQRHYIPAARPSYAVMAARNRHFSAVAQQLLSESMLDEKTRHAVVKAIPQFASYRCHGTRRLLQARLKSLLRRPGHTSAG